MTRAAIDQARLQALACAMRQGYLVTRCPDCGGPRVHSKHPEGGARCFRCGTHSETNIRAGFRKCALCRDDLAGLPLRATLCRACAALPARTRKRRLQRGVEASEGYNGGAPVFASETA